MARLQSGVVTVWRTLFLSLCLHGSSCTLCWLHSRVLYLCLSTAVPSCKAPLASSKQIQSQQLWNLVRTRPFSRNQNEISLAEHPIELSFLACLEYPINIPIAMCFLPRRRVMDAAGFTTTWCMNIIACKCRSRTSAKTLSHRVKSTSNPNSLDSSPLAAYVLLSYQALAFVGITPTYMSILYYDDHKQSPSTTTPQRTGTPGSWASELVYLIVTSMMYGDDNYSSFFNPVFVRWGIRLTSDIHCQLCSIFENILSRCCNKDNTNCNAPCTNLVCL